MIIKSIALALSFFVLSVGTVQAKHKHLKPASVPQCFIICPTVQVAKVKKSAVRYVGRKFIRKASQRKQEARQLIYGGGGVVTTARQYIGSGPVFGRRSLWCATFTNYVLARAGYHGTGSNMASSFARYGHRISGPQIGAIAVMSRGRRGGHVGIVSGIDSHGNPILISGNYRNRVVEHSYSARRIYAYVMPI